MIRGPVLEESSVFRDLGGLPAHDGRRVRRARLFRSDALACGSSADRTLLESLGLRLVCDLRSSAERAALPTLTWLRPAPRSLHLEPGPLLEEGTRAYLAALREAPTAAAAERLMVRTYELLPAALARRLGALFRALLAEEVPVLVHCTAGKDRTGFVTAMILHALGVRHEAVLEDYLHAAAPEHAARNRERTAEIMQLVLGRPLAPEAVAAMSGVQPEFLEASLAVIERDYGSVGGYLERAAGLDAPARCTLQELLLER